MAAEWLQGIVDMLGDEKTQETLAWIGGSIVAIAGAAYAGYKVVFGREAKASKPETVQPPQMTASGGGVNVGGSVHGNVTTHARGKDAPS